MLRRFFKRPLKAEFTISLEKLERRIVLDAAVADGDQDNQDNGDSVDHVAIQNPQEPKSSAIKTASADQAKDNREVFENELNVVLISNALDDLDTIKEAAENRSEVVVYDAENHDIGDINSLLGEMVSNKGDKISGLAIMCHGESGALLLGKQGKYNWFDVQSNPGEWQVLGDLFEEDGSIYLYGCETGEGASGKLLVNSMSQITGADVWASDDITGSGEGRDWSLEVLSGVSEGSTHETKAAFLNTDLLESDDILLAQTANFDWGLDFDSSGLWDGSVNGQPIDEIFQQDINNDPVDSNYLQFWLETRNSVDPETGLRNFGVIEHTFFTGFESGELDINYRFAVDRDYVGSLGDLTFNLEITRNGSTVLNEDYDASALAAGNDGHTQWFEIERGLPVSPTSAYTITITGTNDVSAAVDPGGGDLIIGTFSNDNLTGSGATNRIFGLSGDDNLVGLSGDDFLHGGIGSDWLNGAGGNDSLWGGDGQDYLDGGPGDDTLFSHQDGNTFVENSGVNTMIAFGGNNEFFLNGIENTVYGFGDQALFNITGGDSIVYVEGDIDAYSSSNSLNMNNLHTLGNVNVDFADSGQGSDWLIEGDITGNILTAHDNSVFYVTGDVSSDFTLNGTNTEFYIMGDVTGDLTVDGTGNTVYVADDFFGDFNLTGGSNNLLYIEDSVAGGNQFNISGAGSGNSVFVGGASDATYSASNVSNNLLYIQGNSSGSINQFNVSDSSVFVGGDLNQDYTFSNGTATNLLYVQGNVNADISSQSMEYQEIYVGGAVGVTGALGLVGNQENNVYIEADLDLAQIDGADRNDLYVGGHILNDLQISNISALNRIYVNGETQSLVFDNIDDNQVYVGGRVNGDISSVDVNTNTLYLNSEVSGDVTVSSGSLTDIYIGSDVFGSVQFSNVDDVDCHIEGAVTGTLEIYSASSSEVYVGAAIDGDVIVSTFSDSVLYVEGNLGAGLTVDGGTLHGDAITYVGGDVSGSADLLNLSSNYLYVQGDLGDSLTTQAADNNVFIGGPNGVASDVTTKGFDSNNSVEILGDIGGDLTIEGSSPTGPSTVYVGGANGVAAAVNINEILDSMLYVEGNVGQSVTIDTSVAIASSVLFVGGANGVAADVSYKGVNQNKVHVLADIHGDLKLEASGPASFSELFVGNRVSGSVFIQNVESNIAYINTGIGGQLSVASSGLATTSNIYVGTEGIGSDVEITDFQDNEFFVEGDISGHLEAQNSTNPGINTIYVNGANGVNGDILITNYEDQTIYLTGQASGDLRVSGSGSGSAADIFIGVKSGDSRSVLGEIDLFDVEDLDFYAKGDLAGEMNITGTGAGSEAVVYVGGASGISQDFTIANVENNETYVEGSYGGLLAITGTGAGDNIVYVGADTQGLAIDGFQNNRVHVIGNVWGTMDLGGTSAGSSNTTYVGGSHGVDGQVNIHDFEDNYFYVEIGDVHGPIDIIGAGSDNSVFIGGANGIAGDLDISDFQSSEVILSGGISGAFLFDGIGAGARNLLRVDTSVSGDIQVSDVWSNEIYVQQEVSGLITIDGSGAPGSVNSVYVGAEVGSGALISNFGSSRLWIESNLMGALDINSIGGQSIVTIEGNAASDVTIEAQYSSLYVGGPISGSLEVDSGANTWVMVQQSIHGAVDIMNFNYSELHVFGNLLADLNIQGNGLVNPYSEVKVDGASGAKGIYISDVDDSVVHINGNIDGAFDYQGLGSSSSTELYINSGLINGGGIYVDQVQDNVIYVNETVSGDLSVTGAGPSAESSVYLGGDPAITGTVTINGITDNSFFVENSDVGPLSFTGTGAGSFMEIYVGGSVTSGGVSLVDYETTNLYVEDAINGDLYVESTGAGSYSSVRAAGVTGSATFDSIEENIAYITGAIGGNVTIDGPGTPGSYSDLHVGGASGIGGSVSVSNTLNNKIYLEQGDWNGNMDFTGAAGYSLDVYVGGATGVTGDVNVDSFSQADIYLENDARGNVMMSGSGAGSSLSLFSGGAVGIDGNASFTDFGSNVTYVQGDILGYVTVTGSGAGSTSDFYTGGASGVTGAKQFSQIDESVIRFEQGDWDGDMLLFGLGAGSTLDIYLGGANGITGDAYIDNFDHTVLVLEGKGPANLSIDGVDGGSTANVYIKGSSTVGGLTFSNLGEVDLTYEDADIDTLASTASGSVGSFDLFVGGDIITGCSLMGYADSSVYCAGDAKLIYIDGVGPGSTATVKVDGNLENVTIQDVDDSILHVGNNINGNILIDAYGAGSSSSIYVGGDLADVAQIMDVSENLVYVEGNLTSTIGISESDQDGSWSKVYIGGSDSSSGSVIMGGAIGGSFANNQIYSAGHLGAANITGDSADLNTRACVYVDGNLGGLSVPSGTTDILTTNLYVTGNVDQFINMSTGDPGATFNAVVLGSITDQIVNTSTETSDIYVDGNVRSFQIDGSGSTPNSSIYIGGDLQHTGYILGVHTSDVYIDGIIDQENSTSGLYVGGDDNDGSVNNIYVGDVNDKGPSGTVFCGGAVAGSFEANNVYVEGGLKALAIEGAGSDPSAEVFVGGNLGESSGSPLAFTNLDDFSLYVQGNIGQSLFLQGSSAANSSASIYAQGNTQDMSIGGIFDPSLGYEGNTVYVEGSIVGDLSIFGADTNNTTVDVYIGAGAGSAGVHAVNSLNLIYAQDLNLWVDQKGIGGSCIIGSSGLSGSSAEVYINGANDAGSVFSSGPVGGLSVDAFELNNIYIEDSLDNLFVYTTDSTATDVVDIFVGGDVTTQLSVGNGAPFSSSSHGADLANVYVAGETGQLVVVGQGTGATGDVYVGSCNTSAMMFDFDDGNLFVNGNAPVVYVEGADYNSSEAEVYVGGAAGQSVNTISLDKIYNGDLYLGSDSYLDGQIIFVGDDVAGSSASAYLGGTNNVSDAYSSVVAMSGAISGTSPGFENNMIYSAESLASAMIYGGGNDPNATVYVGGNLSNGIFGMDPVGGSAMGPLHDSLIYVVGDVEQLKLSGDGAGSEADIYVTGTADTIQTIDVEDLEIYVKGDIGNSSISPGLNIMGTAAVGSSASVRVGGALYSGFSEDYFANNIYVEGGSGAGLIGTLALAGNDFDGSKATVYLNGNNSSNAVVYISGSGFSGPGFESNTIYSNDDLDIISIMGGGANPEATVYVDGNVGQALIGDFTSSDYGVDNCKVYITGNVSNILNLIGTGNPSTSESYVGGDLNTGFVDNFHDSKVYIAGGVQTYLNAAGTALAGSSSKVYIGGTNDPNAIVALTGPISGGGGPGSQYNELYTVKGIDYVMIQGIGSGSTSSAYVGGNVDTLFVDGIEDNDLYINGNVKTSTNLTGLGDSVCSNDFVITGNVENAILQDWAYTKGRIEGSVDGVLNVTGNSNFQSGEIFVNQFKGGAYFDISNTTNINSLYVGNSIEGSLLINNGANEVYIQDDVKEYIIMDGINTLYLYGDDSITPAPTYSYLVQGGENSIHANTSGRTYNFSGGTSDIYVDESDNTINGTPSVVTVHDQDPVVFPTFPSLTLNPDIPSITSVSAPSQPSTPVTAPAQPASPTEPSAPVAPANTVTEPGPPTKPVEPLTKPDIPINPCDAPDAPTDPTFAPVEPVVVVTPTSPPSLISEPSAPGMPSSPMTPTFSGPFHVKPSSPLNSFSAPAAPAPFPTEPGAPTVTSVPPVGPSAPTFGFTAPSAPVNTITPLNSGDFSHSAAPIAPTSPTPVQPTPVPVIPAPTDYFQGPFYLVGYFDFKLTTIRLNQPEYEERAPDLPGMEEFENTVGQKPVLNKGGLGIDLSDLNFDFTPFFKAEGVEAPGPGFETGAVASFDEAAPFKEIRLGLAEFLKETENRWFENNNGNIMLVFNAGVTDINKTFLDSPQPRDMAANDMDSSSAGAKDLGSLSICLGKLSFLDIIEDYNNEAKDSKRLPDSSEDQQKECAMFHMKSLSLSKLVG